MPEAAATAQDQNLTVIKRNVTKMENMIETFKVTNEEELKQVAVHIANIAKLKKVIQENKKQYVDPAKAIIAKANADHDPHIKRCDEVRDMLNRMAIEYHEKQEAERKAKEEKIAAKVEAGTMKPETAVKKMEALTTPTKTVSTDTGSKMSFSKRKVPRITDPALVPDEFWIIDEVKVRREALARAELGQEQIPGVIIEEVTGTVNRAS